MKPETHLPALTEQSAFNAAIATGQVAQMVQRWKEGQGTVLEDLVDLLYPDLQRLAQFHMAGERRDHALQPTALVNELYSQLARATSIACIDRHHFLVIASRAMRRLLVEHARSYDGQGCGDKDELREMPENYPAPWDSPEKITAITELLDRLEVEEPRMARVIEMSYFGQLTFREIGTILSIDERTAERDAQVARAWISSQLRKGPPHVTGSVGAS